MAQEHGVKCYCSMIYGTAVGIVYQSSKPKKPKIHGP
jgi:hypothetical protein